MGVKLVASSGGSVELVPTNTASNFTVTVPAGTGTVAVQGASTNIVSGTAVASTSGTSIDFTGIPSWVKRITIVMDGVSFAATGVAVVRLGVSNTLVTTGYVASRLTVATTPAVALVTNTDGIASIATGVAASIVTGSIVLTNLTGNQWVSSGQIARTNDVAYGYTNGSITLAGVLTNLSLVATTSTFDAGSINILYE